MSYYHTTRKPSKAEAKADLMRQFDEVTIAQFPIHARDRRVVEGHLDAVLGVLPSDDTRDVAASITGFISAAGDQITSVSVSASASLAFRQP